MRFLYKDTAPKKAKHGLIINRDNFYKTLSVTQTVISDNVIFVNHSDLIQNEEYSITF